MRVDISFDIDVADLNESALDDLIADWTYEMRVSRRLRTDSWRIHYVAECAGIDNDLPNDYANGHTYDRT